MNIYSEEIVKAYHNWMLKVEAVPSNSYSIDYTKKQRAQKRAGDKFEKLCKDAGLNYLKVCSDLMPKFTSL